jgi:hypothetical protein
MSIEKERKAFEEWYEKAYLNTDIGYLMHNGRYSSRRKQHSWDAWQASANREGYKLVPVVDTDAMWSAGRVIIEENGYSADASDVYKAMIGVCDG